MALEFKLETFEGPLDLLLHLIDKNKVDIYDIPIAEITDQYMEYVNALQKQDGEEIYDMDTMSEFLVMAATLLDIKCKMLLPKEVNEEGEETDPRDELVHKLLEYKMYKYMAEELSTREGSAGQSFYRAKKVPKEVAAYIPPVDYDELIGDTTLTTLNEIFNEIMRRQSYRVDPVRSKFGTIEKQDVDISGKQIFIKAYLNNNRHTSFRKLLEGQNTKADIIVSFLVILELMKTGKVVVSQDETFGDITIDTLEELKVEEDDDLAKDFG